jgi:hypothetical protein
MQQHLNSLSHSNKEHAYRRMRQLSVMTDRMHPNSDRLRLIKGDPSPSPLKLLNLVQTPKSIQPRLWEMSVSDRTG